MFFSSGELRIKVDGVIKSTLFLYPSSTEDDQSRGTLLTGTVQLILPKAKAVESLKIKLEGKSSYNAGGGSLHEEDIWLKEEIVWDGKSEVLEAGEYSYPFSFNIPADSPEYQRCLYGRSTLFLSSVLVSSATFKSTITSRVISVFLLANPASRGELPDPFNQLLTGWTEDVGPIRINISSPHLTISSLVLFDIALPSSPSTLVLKSVRAFLTQTFEIRYKDGRIVYPPKQTHTLFSTFPLPICTSSKSSSSSQRSKSNSPKTSSIDLPSSSSSSSDTTPTASKITATLPPLIEGQEWQYSKLGRIPHDDIVRATTCEGSKSRVRVSHEIGVEIAYTLKDDSCDNGCKKNYVEKKAILKKNVHIISCCCLRSDLLLPKYQPESAIPSPPITPTNLDSQCACTFTFKELIAQEEEIDEGFITSINLQDRCRGATEKEGSRNRVAECKSAAIGGGRDELVGRRNFSFDS